MASQQAVVACATCSKTAAETTLSQCSKCKVAQYCSKECQRADWENHKKPCRNICSGLRPYEDSCPGSPDDALTVPLDMDEQPAVVRFGPPMTVGEIRATKPGPKKIHPDVLYNPTPQEIHQHCMDILDKHKKEGSTRRPAKKS